MVPPTVTVSSAAAVPSSAGVRVKVAVASVCRAGIVRVKSGTAAKPTTPASPEPLTATVTGRSSTSAPPATVAVTVTPLAPDPSESAEWDSDEHHLRRHHLDAVLRRRQVVVVLGVPRFHPQPRPPSPRPNAPA